MGLDEKPTRSRWQRWIWSRGAIPEYSRRAQRESLLNGLETSLRRVANRTFAKLTRRHALQGMLAASGLALVGCSTGVPGVGQSSADDALLAWPAEDRWPEQFHKALPKIQEAYRFAVANQDLLQWMPCFCGCGEWGHTSNAHCYVQEMRNDGSVLLDPMSYG